MKLTVREERAEDYYEVSQIVETAFRKAEFSDHTEHVLVDRLRRSASFIPELSLVAEADGDLVGHILFTEVLVGAERGVALAPVSVLPEFQGRGIGSRLIDRGHRIAKALGYKVSIVLGHPDYYPRFGYVPAIFLGIVAPFDVPDEAYLAKVLITSSECKGKVVYAKEFEIE